MKMIAIRIHTSRGERILAAADEELLGRTFREGDARITVSETFYRGEVVPEEVLAERMKSVTIMNLVGERAVSVGISEGHVAACSVVTIGGVMHAQAMRM